MFINQVSMPGLQASGTLADGNAVTVGMAGKQIPSTVSVVPAAGDTISVQVSRDGGITYYDWINGDVTSATDSESLYAVLQSGVTHVKFQRTAGTGTTSTWAIC